MDFKVGDKVSLDKTSTIGTITKITEKRKEITVDFGKYTMKFNSCGYRSNGKWQQLSHIVPVTDELLATLYQKKTINKCINMLEIAKKDLTFERAEKIIDFLQGFESYKPDEKI